MKTKKIDINSLKSIYKNSKKQVNNLKEKSKPVLEKAKQSYQTVINTVDKIINPPKAEVLKNKITEAQKQFLIKDLQLSSLKNSSPKDYYAIYYKQSELTKAGKAVEKATLEYNKFAAQQSAAQKAFDELNNIKTNK